jgi:hypothetical protein
MSNNPLTCEVRYRIDPTKLADFRAYAKIWIRLIERHGGTHHGYFIPREKPIDAGLSFPGVGEDGASDVAVAFFSFPDEEAYLTYRSKVAEDPDCIAANARFAEAPPFNSYERIFLQPLSQEG